MIPYDKIKFRDLKGACKSANLSGLLPKNIIHNGVKGPIVYDNFLAAIEALPDDVKVELPDDVVDFYNYVIMDEEEEEALEELNFDPEEVSAPDLEEAPDVLEEVDSDHTTEITPTPVQKTESKTTTKKKEGEREKADPKKRTQKKRVHHSTVVMTLTIDDVQLIIEFKEIKKKKVFELPPKGDLDKLKVFRKIAMGYATECGATSGQRAAVSKALNSAGYYVTRRGSK